MVDDDVPTAGSSLRHRLRPGRRTDPSAEGSSVPASSEAGERPRVGGRRRAGSPDPARGRPRRATRWKVVLAADEPWSGAVYETHAGGRRETFCSPEELIGAVTRLTGWADLGTATTPATPGEPPSSGRPGTAPRELHS